MNNKIFTTVCELLENGANERDHDFHIMTFCTIGKEGVEARRLQGRGYRQQGFRQKGFRGRLKAEGTGI